jgi:hypothetical protein
LKRLICLAVLLPLLLSGCSRLGADKEVKYGDLPKSVRSSFDEHADKNGSYICSSSAGRSEAYLLIDASHPTPDGTAVSIAEVTLESVNNDLKIFCTTAPRDSDGKEEKNRAYYRINKNHDSIHLYMDGIETPFDFVEA